MTEVTEEWISQFNNNIKGVNWNKDLTEQLHDYLKGPSFSLNNVSSLMDSVTKLVEVNLRNTVQRVTGTNIPRNKRWGVDLLNYARTKGFIPDPKKGTECLYDLIYWFFSTPRNTSHHTFTVFPLPMLLLCVSSANYILNEIERLSEGTEFYEGKVEAICLPNYDITFNVENITKGGESVEVRSLNVHLTHPDNSIDKIPLIRSEDKWHITIPTYGMEPGPYRFDVAGFAPGRKKIVISSGSLVLDLYNDQGQ